MTVKKNGGVYSEFQQSRVWVRERKEAGLPVQENEGLIELPDSHRWADPPWQLGSMPERRMEEIEEDQPTRNKKFMVN
jgi:hypothetical protein